MCKDVISFVDLLRYFMVELEFCLVNGLYDFSF